MDRIKERFEGFKDQGYFSRVDATHILELHIGIDENGNKAIELRSAFKPRKVIGTSAIEVSQYSKTTYNTIRFSLIDDEISGLFYKFCEDLVEQTASLSDKNEGYQAIINRFYQWKKLFILPKRDHLTEPEIMGLIGEVLFLKGNLSIRISLSEALKSWSGQELTHKDFSHADTWFEVKAVSRGSQTVKISSLEQLDSDANGELVIFSLEKMSAAYSGVTLNKLVLDTQVLFATDEEKADFLAKVAMQGYEYSDFYDNYVYEISSMKRYLVSDSFPKLTRLSLPSAIRKAIYEISIIDIAEFEIKE